MLSAGVKRKRALSHKSDSQTKKSKSDQRAESLQNSGKNEGADASAVSQPEHAAQDPVTIDQPLKERLHNHTKNNM